jgi:hypothetical protein
MTERKNPPQSPEASPEGDAPTAISARPKSGGRYQMLRRLYLMDGSQGRDRVREKSTRNRGR